MKSIDAVPRGSIPYALAAAFALVVGLSGCASPVSPDQVHPAAVALDPLRAAEDDAQDLVASFQRMPGAVRISSGSTGVPGESVMPDKVENGQPVAVNGYFRVLVSETAALDEAKAYLPSWADAKVPTTEHGSFGAMTTQGFSVFHDSTGTIVQRVISVISSDLTAGTSLVYVAVTEVYRPARPAAENFPADGVLGVVARPASPGSKPADFEISDEATIARIAGILNVLPTVPDYGPASCPALPVAGSGALQSIELTFRRSAGTAVIQTDLYQPLPDQTGVGPCDFAGEAWVSVGKTGEPALDLTADGAYTQVARLLGLPGGS